MVSRRFACLFLAVSMTLSSIWIVSADQSHQIQDAAEAAASYSAAVQALEEAGLSQSAQANSNIAIDLGMLEQEETVDLSQLAVQAVQLQQEEEARQAEAARQANREALATVVATIAVIIFWCLTGFGLADSDITFCHTPLWVWGGCVGTWLFAIAVTVFLTKKVFVNFDLDDSTEDKQHE